jgi:hypothetical protein
MPVDPERQASYDQLRERFLSDPDFRAAVTADPTGALEGVLGPLSSEESQAVRDITATPRSDDELVEHIRSGGLGAW